MGKNLDIPGNVWIYSQWYLLPGAISLIWDSPGKGGVHMVIIIPAAQSMLRHSIGFVQYDALAT